MHYKSPSFTCILTSYICDGTDDCLDKSDEVNYGNLISTKHNTTSHEDSQTYLTAIGEDLYYECHQGNWIPLTQLCDGQYDCSDETDELSCATSKACDSKLLIYAMTVSVKVWLLIKMFIIRSSRKETRGLSNNELELNKNHYLTDITKYFRSNRVMSFTFLF